MKILAFSDVHCDMGAVAALVAAAGDADLVIGAGDFAQLHQGLEPTMAALEPIAAKAVYVPGNNETHEALAGATSARVLHGGITDIDGIRIAGIGCAIPPLPPTPWNSYDMTEIEAQDVLGRMGSADVLITHSPPKGVVDIHASLGSLGSLALLDWITDHQPELVLCGHVHDCWGQEGAIDMSRICNLGPGGTWFEL